jgi:Zn-dependent protease
MTDSNHRSQLNESSGGEALDESPLAASASRSDEFAVFDWTDGQGLRWQIQASPEALVLTGPERRLDLAREQWRSAISFSQVGPNVVIHVDAGDREIGFMVPTAAAHALFSSMGRRESSSEASRRPAQARPSTAAASGRRPMWPKMSALPIVALFSSVLAFVPIAGILFGIVTFVCAFMALRRARADAAHLHIRVVSKISIGIATAGLAICAFATFSLTNCAQTGTDPWLLLIGDHVEWSWGAGIAAIFMILIALTIHEAAHAITAWWSGDDYARSLGRVTLNPLAHIDPMGTVLLPILLVSAGMPAFGYARPVPVRLGHVPRYRRAHILISAAGPGSNLLQAAICLALLLLMGILLRFAPEGVQIRNFSSLQPIVEIEGMVGGKVLAALALMLKLGFQVNLSLAFFNMLPVPPLDGSWIAEHMAPRTIGRFFEVIRPYGFIIFVALLWTDVLDFLLMPMLYPIGAGHLLLAQVTGM